MDRNIRIAKELVRLAKSLVEEDGKKCGCSGARTGGEVVEKTMVLDVPYDDMAFLDDDDAMRLGDDGGGAAGVAVEEKPEAVEPKKTVFSFGDLLDIAFEKMCRNMKKAFYKGVAPEDRGRGEFYTLAGTAMGASNGVTLKKISENGDQGEVTASAELSNHGQLPSIKVHLRFFGLFYQGRGKESENAQDEQDYVFPVAFRGSDGLPLAGKDGKWYVPSGYRKDDIATCVASYLRGWLATSRAAILSQVAQNVVNPNAGI